MGSNPIPSTIH